jgi:hypothetical protein
MNKQKYVFDSNEYWEKRYAANNNSGSGSYGQLSRWKGEILNKFTSEHKIESLIDYGVGDGNQLTIFELKNIQYYGLDVSETIINKLKKIYKNDKNKNFEIIKDRYISLQADLVISFDVLYHLIDDNIYMNYLHNLFTMSKKYVIIYSSNFDNRKCEHVLHRQFKKDVEKFFPNYKLINFYKQKYPAKKEITNNTSYSDFFIFEKQYICVSLTSVFERQEILTNTLNTIINQKLKPDIIYLNLSEDNNLIGKGFKDKIITNEALKNIIDNNSIIKVQWGKDIGPYSKLLPTLNDIYTNNKECFVITIDDDVYYDKSLIFEMISDYNREKCVICYRSMKLIFDNIDDIDYSNNIKITGRHLYNFHTGVGGVLYHSNMFKNKIIFDSELYNLILSTDDIWFNMIRIINNIDCYSIKEKWNNYNHDNKNSLSYKYNCGSNNGKNTKNLRLIINKLKDKYTFNKDTYNKSFILTGYGRSGTTFLYNILNLSKRWSIFHESKTSEQDKQKLIPTKDGLNKINYTEIDIDNIYKRFDNNYYGEVNSFLRRVYHLMNVKSALLLRNPIDIFLSVVNRKEETQWQYYLYDICTTYELFFHDIEYNKRSFFLFENYTTDYKELNHILDFCNINDIEIDTIDIREKININKTYNITMDHIKKKGLDMTKITELSDIYKNRYLFR